MTGSTGYREWEGTSEMECAKDTNAQYGVVDLTPTFEAVLKAGVQAE